jgi:hypothetical protein
MAASIGLLRQSFRLIESEKNSGRHATGVSEL